MGKRPTPHISRRADQAIQIISGTFTGPAQKVFLEKEAGAVREWLRERFGKLGVNSRCNIDMRRNSYHKTLGLGLERITVKVVHGSTQKELLLDDEWQSPMIGVMTPNLFPDAPLSVTSFDMGLYDGEEITNMSKSPLLVYANDPLAAAGFESALRPNDKFSITGFLNQIDFVIANAGAVHEKIVELGLLKELGLDPEGVYTCRYITTEV